MEKADNGNFVINDNDSSWIENIIKEHQKRKIYIF